MNNLSVTQSATFTTADRIRFIGKLENAADPNACWIWQGAKHGQGRGYGKFHLNGKTVSAHKAAYLLFEGPVEEGLVLGHLCNREDCANPHHLVPQTQSDNLCYAVICGRHNSQH